MHEKLVFHMKKRAQAECVGEQRVNREGGGKRSAYRVLVGTPQGKRPLGRPRHTWEDDIKENLKGIGWGAWTGLI